MGRGGGLLVKVNKCNKKQKVMHVMHDFEDGLVASGSFRNVVLVNVFGRYVIYPIGLLLRTGSAIGRGISSPYLTSRMVPVHPPFEAFDMFFV